MPKNISISSLANAVYICIPILAQFSSTRLAASSPYYPFFPLQPMTCLIQCHSREKNIIEAEAARLDNRVSYNTLEIKNNQVLLIT